MQMLIIRKQNSYINNRDNRYQNKEQEEYFMMIRE